MELPNKALQPTPKSESARPSLVIGPHRSPCWGKTTLPEGRQWL